MAPRLLSHDVHANVAEWAGFHADILTYAKSNSASFGEYKSASGADHYAGHVGPNITSTYGQFGYPGVPAPAPLTDHSGATCAGHAGPSTSTHGQFDYPGLPHPAPQSAYGQFGYTAPPYPDLHSSPFGSHGPPTMSTIKSSLSNWDGNETCRVAPGATSPQKEVSGNGLPASSTVCSDPPLCSVVDGNIDVNAGWSPPDPTWQLPSPVDSMLTPSLGDSSRRTMSISSSSGVSTPLSYEQQSPELALFGTHTDSRNGLSKDVIHASKLTLDRSSAACSLGRLDFKQNKTSPSAIQSPCYFSNPERDTPNMPGRLTWAVQEPCPPPGLVRSQKRSNLKVTSVPYSRPRQKNGNLKSCPNNGSRASHRLLAEHIALNKNNGTPWTPEGDHGFRYILCGYDSCQHAFDSHLSYDVLLPIIATHLREPRHSRPNGQEKYPCSYPGCHSEALGDEGSFIRHAYTQHYFEIMDLTNQLRCPTCDTPVRRPLEKKHGGRCSVCRSSRS